MKMYKCDFYWQGGVCCLAESKEKAAEMMFPAVKGLVMDNETDDEIRKAISRRIVEIPAGEVAVFEGDR